MAISAVVTGSLMAIGQLQSPDHCSRWNVDGSAQMYTGSLMTLVSRRHWIAQLQSLDYWWQCSTGHWIIRGNARL